MVMSQIRARRKATAFGGLQFQAQCPHRLAKVLYGSEHCIGRADGVAIIHVELGKASKPLQLRVETAHLWVH